LIRPSVASL